jgi:hypothetical protein
MRRMLPTERFHTFDIVLPLNHVEKITANLTEWLICKLGRIASSFAAWTMHPILPITIPDVPEGLSSYGAVQKELGLKLNKAKRSIPVIVVDQLDEKPIGVAGYPGRVQIRRERDFYSNQTAL